MGLHCKPLAFWVKFSADHILKCFYFFQKTGFDISANNIVSHGNNLHELSNPVSWKNKKNIVNLSSAELAQRVVKVNI